MGKIGFGGYRISSRSKYHYECLLHALKSGISLIDTSANYTNGESEELIGNVLKDHPEFTPVLITKAGYIQGKNISRVEQKNLTQEMIDISENLKHSIHPDFLEDQLSSSLRRLQKESVDVFLLHNPEYYFKSPAPTKIEFYSRIERAFLYLESEVQKGRIKSYGISSNHFILPHNDPEFVSLENIFEIAKKINSKHHFTHVQFPLNLIEIGALEKLGNYGEMSLVEFCQFNNLVSIANRPLNAFSNNQLVRLATYESEIAKLDEAAANKHFEYCIELIENKWNVERIKEGDEEIDDLKDLTIIKQFSEMWNKLPTPDAVDQIYFAHLYPFIAQIWGGSLSEEESRPFYQLHEMSLLYSVKLLDAKARLFRDRAISVGLIQEISAKDFALEVIETYLNYGIDYVLVGMKKTEYIDQLKSLF